MGAMTGQRPVHSVAPLMGFRAYQTYSITAQQDRYVVQACKDAGCSYWREGWESPVDERTEQGRMWAFMIRKQSGRSFRELQRADGFTVFRFDPYQRCFQEHRTKADLFIARIGDWRGNPLGDPDRELALARQAGRVHTRPQDWVEDCMEHEGRLADERAKG
jgi:hypothetical protein